MSNILPTYLRGYYQIQDSQMTLQEGLNEYYKINPHLDNPVDIKNPISALYFRNHDACHVFFGTHTGNLNEAVNDFLTIWGVDIVFKTYITGFLRTRESKSVLKQFLKWKMFLTIFRALKFIPTIRRHTNAMTKKWTWTPNKEYYNRSLNQLRLEFGYKVFYPQLILKIDD